MKKCKECGRDLPQSSTKKPEEKSKARTKALNVEKVDTEEHEGEPESEVPKGKRNK